MVSNSSSALSKVKFIVDNDYLFEYKEKIEYLGIFATSLLRTYGGVTEDYVKINEYNFANRNKLTQQQVRSNLLRLQKDGIIKFIPSRKGQQIKFIVPRNEKYTIGRIAKSIENRNNAIKNRINAMIDYSRNKEVCRNQQMLEYFDQSIGEECGICDICISKKGVRIKTKLIENKIIEILKKGDASSRDISFSIDQPDKDILVVINYLLEKNIIVVTKESKYHLL